MGEGLRAKMPVLRAVTRPDVSLRSSRNGSIDRINGSGSDASACRSKEQHGEGRSGRAAHSRRSQAGIAHCLETNLAHPAKSARWHLSDGSDFNLQPEMRVTAYVEEEPFCQSNFVRTHQK